MRTAPTDRRPLLSRRRWRTLAIRAQDLLLRAGAAGVAHRLGARLLIGAPDDIRIWRALARSAEALGDDAAAASLYRQRLPDTLPEPRADRLFDTARRSLQPTSGKRTPRRIESIEQPLDERYPISQPAASTTPALAPYSRRGSLHACSPAVHIIDDALLWHDREHTLVCTGDGTPIPALSAGCETIAAAASACRTPSWVDGECVLLGGRGAGNYYHWLLDHLPKLGALEQAGQRLRPGTRIVLDALTTGFQSESLARLGIDDTRILTTRASGRLLRIERLVVPVLDNRLGLHAGRWQREWLRLHFGLPALQTEPRRSAGRRLFIGRDGARGLERSTRLNSVLEQFGIEVVYPERLPVVDQAVLFDSAELIVGPHGAGLANAVFARPGTALVELYGNYLPPCFWALAEVGELIYDNLSSSAGQAKADGLAADALEESRTLADRSSASIHVNPDALADVLASILARIGEIRAAGQRRAA